MIIMKVLIIVAGFLFLNHNVCEGKKTSVKITLFYESLCPYCIDFVTKQLYETVLTIPHHIKLDLVPYGNAERKLVEGKWEITCQHGEEECYGNSVHACVLAQSRGKSKIKLMETLKCLMKSNYRSNEISKCISLGNFNYDLYSRCMRNLHSILISIYATRTESLIPELPGVPLIMINNVYNLTLSNDAADHLLSVVCQKLDPAPKQCEENEYKNLIPRE